MVKIVKDPHRLLLLEEVGAAIEVRDKASFLSARSAVERAKQSESPVVVWITSAPYLCAFADMETAHPVQVVTPRSALTSLIGRAVPTSVTDEEVIAGGLLDQARRGELITFGPQEGESVENGTAGIGSGKVLGSGPVRPVQTDGRNVKDLRIRLREEVGQESVDALTVKAAEVVGYLPDPERGPASCQGLMFGRIQSGKTVNIIASLAMAADNGYRCFVVLTSDNIWLYDQTLDRLKRSLPGIPIIGKDEWDSKADHVGYNLKLNGVILVATKNVTVLSRLEELLRRVQARPFPALIIDDEADQASLNTKAAKPDEDPSRINELISVLRDAFELRGFLQVTATPQALFLQGIGHTYRPEFTILTDPGPRYVGGLTFFSDLDNPYLEFIETSEVDYLADAKSDDTAMPEGLRRSLCTFYMAATMKLHHEPSATFSYLCHVSLKQAAHKRLGMIIQNFQRDLTLALSGMRSQAQQEKAVSWLREAYYDLAQTTPGALAFDDLVSYLTFSISSTDVQVLNASNAQGQPNYSSKYNILIGGAKLGRGVTIHRLLVTYYGRQTKNPQMDTVLQHARMYGYRDPDLTVSRIFLTEELARRFQLIYQSEEALRGVVEEHPSEGFEGILVGEKLKATRANVIDPNEVGFFAAGKSYFPPFPEYRENVVESLTAKIDAALAVLPEGATVEISLDIVISVLADCRTVPGKEQGLWESQRVSVALQKVSLRQKTGGKAFLCKLENRNLTNKATGLGAVASQNEVKDYRHPKYPTLLMYRQNGTAEGWEGKPFWIPVICFPDGNYAAVFNYG